MPKILVVEDDPILLDAIGELLHSEQYLVEAVGSGHDASAALRINPYDLVILDWSLPGLSGVDLCRQIRAGRSNVPVLMLTAHADIADKEAGFDAGADDYLTKPFDPRELKARVKSLLRRQGTVIEDECRIGNICLNRKSRKVTVEGREIKLLPTEFALLELFLRYPNQVFSTEGLLDRLWESDGTHEGVRTAIKRLRQKIDLPEKPSVITTIHGVGYRLET